MQRVSPHDWEHLNGETSGERLQKLGRKNLKFLSRLEGDVQSKGGDNSGILKNLGKDILKIFNQTEDKNEQSKKEFLTKNYSSSENDVTMDWDTSNWGIREIEHATDCVLEEIEKSTSSLIRSIKLDILQCLIRKHQESMEFVQNDLERLVHKCFPPVVLHCNSPLKYTNLSHMLCMLAPFFANRFSELDISMKICKLLSHNINIKATIIQTLRRKGDFQQKIESLQKKSMSRPEEGETSQLFYVLIGQIDRSRVKLHAANCKTIIQYPCILFLIKHHICKKSKCCIGALKLLQELASRKNAISTLLSWGFTDIIIEHMAKDKELEKQFILASLRALEAISKSYAALSFEFDEHMKTYYISHLFRNPKLFDILFRILYSSKWDLQIAPWILDIIFFLSHSEKGYVSVLSQITKLGGRDLELLVKGLNDQSCHIIVLKCYAILKLVAMRQSGKSGLLSSKIIQMMLKNKNCPSNIVVSLMATLCDSELKVDDSFISRTVTDTIVNRELYEELMHVSVNQSSGSALALNGCLQSVIQYIVNDLSPSHFFDVSFDLRLMGSIILHNILQYIRDDDAHLYLSIINYFGLILDLDNDSGNGFSDEYDNQLLIESSIEAALWGLYKICWTKTEKIFSDEMSNESQEVMTLVISHQKLITIKKFLSYSNVPNQPIANEMHERRLKITKAAAALISIILAIPDTERLELLTMESSCEVKSNDTDRLSQLQKTLDYTVDTFIGIMCCCDRYDIVMIAIDVLTKFAAIEKGREVLLSRNLMERLQSVFFSSTIFGDFNFWNKKNLDRIALTNSFQISLLDQDPSIFKLISNLSRSERGKNKLKESGVFSICNNRFLATSNSAADQAVKGEIALIYTRMAPNIKKAPLHQIIPILLQLIQKHHDGNKRILYNSVLAIYKFSQDRVGNLPTMISAGTVGVLCKVVQSQPRISPILRPVLETLHNLATFPHENMKRRFIGCGLHDDLLEISSDNELQATLSALNLKKKTYGEICMGILFILSKPSSSETNEKDSSENILEDLSKPESDLVYIDGQFDRNHELNPNDIIQPSGPRDAINTTHSLKDQVFDVEFRDIFQEKKIRSKKEKENKILCHQKAELVDVSEFPILSITRPIIKRQQTQVGNC